MAAEYWTTHDAINDTMPSTALAHSFFTTTTRQQVPGKDHAFPLRCVTAILAGAALIAAAILLPVHSLISATFVLAMALLGVYAICKGIHLLFNPEEECQEDHHGSTMGLS